MLEYLDDVRSDFSVFHRIDTIEDLPARRFFSLARRLPHYEGAMRHIAMAEARRDEPGVVTPEPEPVTQPGNDDAIAGNLDLMAIHPVWGSIGSYSKAPAMPEA